MSANNNVTLVGRIGNTDLSEDLKSITAKGGSTSVSKLDLRIAVSKPKRKGEEQKPMWVSVDVWGPPAENLVKYKRKGDEVTVHGELEIDQWEKDGQKFTKYKVNARDVHFNSGPSKANDSAPAQKAVSQDEDEFALDDDELPPF